MTDIEFDVLDELYFVQSFQKLSNSLNIKELEVKMVLQELLKKGWIKCFYQNKDEIVTESELDFENKYAEYAYLATKEGLLAHNSR